MSNESKPARALLFAVFQTGAQANGGVESVTRLIEGLTGHPRIVVTNQETRVCARWRQAGATVMIWDLPYAVGDGFRAQGAGGILRRLASYVRTNLAVWKLARAGRMDVLHCNDPAPFWHAVPAARLAGKKVIFNLRDTKASPAQLDGARYRRRFGWCDLVLVLSREMRDFYLSVYAGKSGPKTPVEYLYSVVDLDRMRPLEPGAREALRQRLGIPAGSFAIGFVAAFNDKKNQLDYLNQAGPALRARFPNAVTFFAGDFDPAKSAYARACEAAARQHGLADTVRFTGYTRSPEEWYQACDVVIVPTRQEGLARCMIEALACGTPVVSFDVCSAREILEEGNCGRVVRQGDYGALVTALAELAGSPGQGRELGARGRTLAEKHFAAESCLAAYERVIVDLSHA